MSNDEELLSIDNSVKYYEVQLETRIRQLENENDSLIELNNSYKNEIHQKTILLNKSAKEYSKLKTQYDELQMKFKKLSKINDAKEETQIDPNDNDDVIISLRKQVQQITQRKEYYKKELEKSEAALSNLNRELQKKINNKENNLILNELEQLINYYYQDDKSNVQDKVEYIINGTKELIRNAEQNRKINDKYQKLKEKHKIMLSRFKTICETIHKTQNFIKIALQDQKRNEINSEIEKMINFVNHYEKKSNYIGDIYN